ncbi:hypothetical protein [Carboxylicivirga sp. RSCT41]
MSTTKRNYKYSNINMLVASQVITKHFAENIEELSTIRTNWTPD